MIEISRNQANALVAGNCPVPAYLTINGIQQEYRVTQVETERSDFSLYGETPEMKFMAELEKVPMSEIIVAHKVEDKVETKEPKLKGYKLNPNYTTSAGDYFWVADWENDEIKELVAMTPKSWWYNRECKLERGFAGEDFLLFSSGTFGTAIEDDIPWGARRIFKSDILAPIYNPENIVVTWGDVALDFSDLVFIPQPKKERPELKYTELWMADTSNDMMGVMSGYLTHGKYYDIVAMSSNFKIFEVMCDNGIPDAFYHKWFKPVRLYDEDESELICRDIEFAEGDYIDLRKHTPEQIRHIAKYYNFLDVDDLLIHKEYYQFVIFNEDGCFDGCSEKYIMDCGVKEYTYDDIFYSEEN